MKPFQTKLERFNSNLWHYHIVIPKKIATPFIDGVNKRIICHINQTITFQAALMPSGKGDFFININAEIRKRGKLKELDVLTVIIEKDTSEFGLPICEEFTELLEQDLEGSDYFNALTMGKKRTLIYIIGKPKSAELRIRNGIAILNHLKNLKGKINYKQLQLDIKNLS